MKSATMTLVFLLLAATCPAQQFFLENFSGTAYENVANTSAVWDTTATTLHLERFTPTFVGSVNTIAFAKKICVDGNYAYLANGASGLQVIDISDDANPVVVGQLDTPSDANDVTVSGNLAFVADGLSGLQIIDISNPAAPFVVGSYDTPDYASAVVVAGDLAFVADWTTGLLVIDITDPALPILVGSLNTSGSSAGLAVAGNVVFLADWLAGLQVIDVTTPSAPVLVGNYDTVSRAVAVAVTGDYALVASQGSGLLLIDITDPSLPGLISTYDAVSVLTDVAVSGNFACFTTGLGGMEYVDISDLNAPVSLGSYDTPGSAQGIALSGTRAFVADKNQGLQVINIRENVAPYLWGTLNVVDDIYDLAVAGDWVYTVDQNSFDVYDSAAPGSPVMVASLAVPGGAGSLVISGDLALLTSGNGLLVVNISDTINPFIIATYGAVPNLGGIDVAGDLVFLTSFDTGLSIVDISVPAAPVGVGNLPMIWGAYGLTVVGNYAFLIGDPEILTVVDISDPTLPTIAGSTFAGNNPTGIEVVGNYAFVTNPGDGLFIYDISDPAAPTFPLIYNDYPAVRKIKIDGDFAFILDLYDGLVALDISDPLSPLPLSSIAPSGLLNGIQLAGDVAYVTSGGNRFHTVQVFQHDVTAALGSGESLAVNGGVDNVVRAGLKATETAGITWEISVDAGASWQGVIIGSELNRMNTPANDLRWRSTHIWAPGLNPTVSSLALLWLDEPGFLTAVRDVPNDQGSWVYVEFDRSGYDFADETILPVTGYNVYRRILENIEAPLLSKGRTLASGEEIKTPAGDRAWPVPGEPVVVVGDAAYVIGRTEANKVGTFPPGVWAVAGTVFATQADNYTALIATPADSGFGGGDPAVYLVTTHTTTPSAWFASAPDSGYSVDNIPPGVPMNFVGAYEAGGVTLDWDESLAPDFDHYRIYRGTEPGFVPGAQGLVQETTISGWTDTSTNPWGWYYKLTAVDTAGNESAAGSLQLASSVQTDGVPQRTVLLGAAPNPFNPVTTISFAMATTSQARLAIYDPSGRLVATVLDEIREAGRHQVVWNGLDDNGRRAASGMYLYQLRAGGISQTKRFTMLK